MKVGQKVQIYGMVAYIVGITIGSLKDSEIRLGTIIYHIRIFNKIYKNGYFDFHRTSSDLFQMHKEGEFRII